MRKLLISFTLLFVITSNLHLVASGKKDRLRQAKFPPCRACKTFIESFKKGMDKTAKGKFEGGDVAWEEEKLGSYAKSEIRLVEIQEYVCSDIEEGRDQCYYLHEEYDSEIEEWWFKKQDQHPDLYEYFCIETIRHCCPDHHFGPNCTACSGFPDKVCNNNGKCKGSGTRKGNGQCTCDDGYTGETCDNCSEKYFESYRDESKLLCSPCPVSCAGRCSKAGCEDCAPGWVKGTEPGSCLDINECARSKSSCGNAEFCVNTEGSFKCLQCDKACSSCTGDGPDMCTRCASGFRMVDKICIDEDKESRHNYVYYTRILTYIGLCVATCIILQRNVILAGVIGVCVAIYIAVSEYVLNSPPTPITADIAEKLFKVT